MKVSCTIIIFLNLFIIKASAADLTIDNIRLVNRTDIGSPPHVIFDLSWGNAWNTQKNHDASWIFLKYNKNGYEHPLVSKNGHRVLKNRISNCPLPQIKVSDDQVGLWIYIDEAYRGMVDIKVRIELDTTTQNLNWPKPRNFQVFGIEMVYIPGGGFTLGDPDPSALEYATFYKSDENGNSAGFYQVEDEDEIQVGPNKDFLYYKSKEKIYNGDQSGPIPAAFPKGTEPFYVMKYELTQGQYAQFLNQLPATWTYKRSPVGGIDYHEKKGTIHLKDGRYLANSPDRPMNFISFTDGLAYADWAGLRPITELEYTKASRGPSEPIALGFVWGTNNYDRLERYVDTQGQTVWKNGITEREMTDENLPEFGASYYWVFDLSGSLWEKVITVGNPIGRSFVGSHGNGLLSFGEATNEDWPKSDNEVGGFGYRGGGYYEIGTEYAVFNPHSPIGFRFYGSWSGGPRSIAYGFRAGRSAE